ncbi:hypothetical protein CFOL_v3_08136 [Cephalotus follicularis]|uniref:Protein FAR1-RELATED SEQUENCE n=1 Tax=Cephalotus follicularis TaxID=3775 RepID=A0A1Q3B9G6_CEPFO|nr:hypothetical protein CFOL_v3_08136 [Cephalotus follicularis]
MHFQKHIISYLNFYFAMELDTDETIRSMFWADREDYMTLNSNVVLIGQSSMEKLAGDCYTRVMFKLFQEEFKSIINCWH